MVRSFPDCTGYPRYKKWGHRWERLSTSNSLYHVVARRLSHVLEPVCKHVSKCSLPNTFDSIEQLQLTNQCISFNAASLQATIGYLCDSVLESHVDIGLPEDDLKRLLLMCIETVQFKIDGEIYRRSDGVAIGSPLCLLLADVTLSEVENTTLKESIESMTVYKRCVDDIFCVVGHDQLREDILDHFNSAHANASFMIEVKSDDALAFLDVLIERKPNNLIRRRVHHKATWNGQSTHLASAVSIKR